MTPSVPHPRRSAVASAGTPAADPTASCGPAIAIRTRQGGRIIARALAGIVFVSTVQAATFTVDSTRDLFDASHGDGICADARGRCTLRAAVQETNALPGVDEIVLPAGLFALTLAGGNEDLGWSGDLDVRDDLTLAGAGPQLTRIDANAIDRVLDVHAGTTPRSVFLRHLTLRNGRLDPVVQGHGGAALRVSANTTVDLEDVEVRGNRTENVWAGIALDVAGCLQGRRVLIVDNRSYSAGSVIHVHGADENAMACLDFEDSEIRGNLGLRAGALHADYATIAIRRSLVTDNEAASGAGAFLFNLGAPALLENVTVSGNRGSQAGAIMNDGFSRVDIVNSTITRNGSTKLQQANAGGILDVHGGFGMVHLRNTILAGNEAGWAYTDCNHAQSDGGGNLIGSTADCAFAALPTDQLDVDPMLGPLEDHGGRTFTHHPGPAAIDRGIAEACPATDQRGAPRPVDGNGDGQAACDAGAHEVDAPDDAIFNDGFDATPVP